jgi:hypothetical protein
MNSYVIFPSFWRILAAALLLVSCSLPALAQRATFEEIDSASTSYGYARSWVDVNNDGKDDYCMLAGVDTQLLECYLSTGTGFSPTRLNVALGASDRRHWWADMNGDGQVDLCRQMNDPSLGSSRPVNIQCRMGPTFTAVAQVALPNFYEGICSPDTTCTPPSGAGLRDMLDVFFADVDQDGKSEVCYLHTADNVNYDLRCVAFVGGTVFAGVPSIGRPLSTPGRRDGWPRGFHDVNGDGYPDFCRMDVNRIFCALNSPNGFIGTADYDSATLDAAQYKEGAAFVDVNGDGNTDYCRITGLSSGNYRLSCRVSTGKGWEATERTTPQTILEGDSQNRWWVDINGDGLPDFCRAVGSDPDNGSKRSSLWCRLARGGDTVNGLFGVAEFAFETSVADAIDFGVSTGGRTFCDPFGNGLQTLCRPTFRAVANGTACYEGESGQSCYTTYDNKQGLAIGVYGGIGAAVPTPDAIQASPPLLSAYTDGLGAETRITYLPLSSRHVYAKSGLGTEFPRVQVAQPRSPVVFETRAWRTGASTTLTGTARYFYKDLRVDNQSGSRGFRERWFLTEGSNTLDHTIYYQSLGPTVDASSLLHDTRELGQAKERRLYAVDTSKVREDLAGWAAPVGANTRQRKLSATMYQASTAPASMSTSAVSPPTADNPFMLLKRTVNTLGHTSNDPGTADFVHPRLRPVVATRTESWDWNGSTAVPLPTVDNSIRTSYYGNAVLMQETTTDGSQLWSKKTTNIYGQDNTTDWLLGRLTSTKVESTAPTADVQLAATPSAYGSSPNANTTSSSAASILTLTPPSITNTQVGQISTANATVTNSAGYPIVIAAPGPASVTGQGLSFESTTCSIQLAANASCTIAVRFVPTSVAAAPGTVTVDSGAGVRVAAFTATSLATYTAATLTSTAPNLGTVTWGSAAPAAVATLRNDGNSPMTLTGLTGLSSRFQVTTNTCSNIAPAASCSMTLSMPTNGTGGGGSSSVTTVGATTNASFAVSGTVLSTVSRWSVTSLAFGNVNVGQSSTQNLTLFNDGFGTNANWTSAVSTLANLPAGFTANTSVCGAVAPGGSCSVPITFSPTAAQTYSGSSIRPTNVSYTSNTLAVSGAGAYLPTTLTPSPVSLSFGTLAKDRFKTLSLTLTNSGATAATNLNYALSYTGTAGNYTRSSGTCPAVGGALAAGASCTMSVMYSSNCVGGSVSGKFTISSANLTNALVVNLFAGTSSTGICQ